MEKKVNSISNCIRVLHVFWGDMGSGGAEAVCMTIYRNIDRSKVQFDFVVHCDENQVGFYDEEIKSLGGNIYYLPKYKIYNKAKYVKKWKELLAKKQWKILHGCKVLGAATYLKIAKKFGIKTIMHSHNTSNGRGLKSKLIDLEQRHLKKLADYNIACGIEAGKFMFGEIKNFKVVNNGRDIKKFIFDESIRESIRKELGLDNDFTVINIARFDPQKNLGFLIDVFCELTQIKPNSKLVLVGKGLIGSVIQKKVENLGISDKVLFLGERRDVPNLLQGADVFFLPSLFEGLPTVLLEAQASGLPCITSTNVTDEAAVTDLVKYIDLKKGVKAWAQELAKTKAPTDRISYNQKLIDAGYDIKDVAKKMQEEYYLKD